MGVIAFIIAALLIVPSVSSARTPVECTCYGTTFTMPNYLGDYGHAHDSEGYIKVVTANEPLPNMVNMGFDNFHYNAAEHCYSASHVWPVPDDYGVYVVYGPWTSPLKLASEYPIICGSQKAFMPVHTKGAMWGMEPNITVYGVVGYEAHNLCAGGPLYDCRDNPVGCAGRCMPDFSDSECMCKPKEPCDKTYACMRVDPLSTLCECACPPGAELRNGLCWSIECNIPCDLDVCTASEAQKCVNGCKVSFGGVGFSVPDNRGGKKRGLRMGGRGGYEYR